MRFFAQLLLFALAFGGHTVLYVSIVNRIHAYGWNRKLVDVLTLLCGVLLVLGCWPVVQFAAAEHYPTTWPRLPHLLVRSYGLTSIAVAGIALAHNTWRCLHVERRGGVRHRRTLPIDLGQPPEEWLAPGLPRLLGRLPANQVVKPRFVELELSVPALPTNFDGLTIAHLSDLHMSGRISRGYFDRIVDFTNSVRPDLIALTGDIVERVECLDWIDQSLARLEARQAKLFVLGNHDLMADPLETRRRLVAGGFVDVGGTVATLDLDRGSCVVAGNEMPWFGPAPDTTAVPASSNDFRLALVHTPDQFRWAEERGFHVVLAGHNHGGQIRLPLVGALLAPSIHGTRYACGVFQSRHTVMHVSPGTSSLATMRWNCPPEVALLTLRSG